MKKDMKKVKNRIKVSYDPDADVLALEQAGAAKIDYAQELGTMIVHFTKSGAPVLVEILDAAKTFGESAKPLQRFAQAAFARV